MLKHSLNLLIFVLILFSIGVNRVFAQDNNSLPTYVIQSGDTLFSISLKFNVSVNDLIQTNQLANPDVLTAGTELKIPGLIGIQGKLVTQPIPLGQNMLSLSRYYQIPADTLTRLNRLTSPSEVYVGASLIIPQQENLALKPMQSLGDTESLLEYSAAQLANPWQVASINQVASPGDLIPGEAIFSSATTDTASLGNPLAPYISKLDLAPLPLLQGSTAVVNISSTQPITIEGTLSTKPLHFFKSGENQYVAIQGIHAMADPGLADFSLKITLEDGQTRQLNQMVLLRDGFYPKDPPLTVDPETIDPANTKPEDDLVASKTSQATPDKLWTGMFLKPVEEPSCIKSWFGNRRSYNGGPFSFFHAGLDFGVCANLNIHAAAAGIVVFTGPLTVRGNATIINHGWGVYTGYWHQKEVLVQVGQQVNPGDLIGHIGDTGRVTGPHLHFEVWANGIQVNPEEWLQRTVP